MTDHAIENNKQNINGYRPGHPWYYRLGGRILFPKEILNDAKGSDYLGYREDDIKQIDAKAEPARSEGLRQIRAECLKELKSDMARYREVALEIHAYRQSGDDKEFPISHCPFLAMSLKYSHLFNEFAHLVYIDRLLSIQPDLFS